MLVESRCRLQLWRSGVSPVGSTIWADAARGATAADGVDRIDDAAIERLARDRLGFERLRAGQLRAVSALVAGRDVLAVLPTGGGKSAIYELAGMLREGPTVVVSPLIALQDDQLAHLRTAGLTAIVLNSHQSPRDHAAALATSCGPDSFVFLSPEQLSNSETLNVLERARPGLFAVDEAHLISQWGRDFRTDYRRLGAQADALEVPVRVALTATAAQPIRQEIARRLGLRDPEVVIGDFDRANIGLSARRVRTEAEKHRELTAAAAELAGPGIGGRAFEHAPWKGLLLALGLAFVVAGAVELTRWWLKRRRSRVT